MGVHRIGPVNEIVPNGTFADVFVETAEQAGSLKHPAPSLQPHASLSQLANEWQTNSNSIQRFGRVTWQTNSNALSVELCYALTMRTEARWLAAPTAA